MEDKSAEITTIRNKLQALNKLSTEIEQRIINGAIVAEDIMGEEITYQNILVKINEIADAIVVDYQASGSVPVLVSLMDGGFVFASKLQESLNARSFTFHYTTMQVSSYNFDKSGQVEISTPPKIQLGERDVIILDEVWDTGKTFTKVREFMLRSGARSVDLAVLIDKSPDLSSSSMQTTNIRMQPRWLYSCFTVSPDAFLIGWGLDYDGGCRNLTDVRAVDPATLPTVEEREQLKLIKDLNRQLRNYLREMETQMTSSQSPLLRNSLLNSSRDASRESTAASGMNLTEFTA